jgi:hypothetical protein
MESWKRYPRMQQMVQALRWPSHLPAFGPRPVLPHGLGRSLADSRRPAVSRRTLTVAVGLALLGAVFTARNARLPILRNSLVYARMVESLQLQHLALWQVCSDPSQAHAQGCGFSVLALPFARLAGLNVGLNLASWVATALFIAAMIAFFRRFNGSFDLREEDVPLELVVACFNPLILTQFWSAHADSAFAALFLMSFVLLDRLLKDEVLNETGAVIAYTLTVMLAVFTRPAGLILCPLHLLYVFWHRQQLLARARHRPRRFLLLVASVAVLAAWVGLGKLGHNPLLNLNKGEYQVPVAYLSSVNGLIALVALTFGVLLVVTLPKLRVTQENAPLLLMLAGYVHVVMVFHASIDNLRYFVPVVPFMVLFIVRAIRAVDRKWLVAVSLAAYAVTNGATILSFNDVAANRLFNRLAPRRINWGEFGHFDNLRLGTQVRMKEALDRLNAELPAGASLYYVTAYYDGVADGIYQHAGLLRPDIRIQYAKSLEELGPLPDDAWIFLPERISRHPDDPPGRSLEWLVRGSGQCRACAHQR